MKFPNFMKLALVLIFCSILYECSAAKPSKWHQTIFRAYQAEARRNRLKYQPDTGGAPMHPGFVLSKTFDELLLPELSNDKTLRQTFTRSDGLFYLVCRKSDQPGSLVTRQKTAINTLQDKRGKTYVYRAMPRKNRENGITFEFIQTPLTKTEKKKIKDDDKLEHLCNYAPMPGLRLLKNKHFNTDKTYKYGQVQKKCHYFELGIETVKPENNDIDDIARTLYDGAWAGLYYVCYDIYSMVTSFTKHTIYSEHLLNRKLNPNVKVNPDDEKIFVDKEMDAFYDLDNQQRSLESGGSEKEKKAFDKETNYFVRAHLVPDYDTLYESWQYVTRNYLNYTPMWRTVNLGQFLKVEQDIRNMALSFKKNLTVYTGVYYRKNSSKLIIPVKTKAADEASSSKSASVFKSTKVEPKSIPIPAAFYKYVHSTEAGIVIITANGVSGSVDDIKCANVCAAYGWMYMDNEYRHRNDETSGTTKCCTPDEFFKNEEILASLPSLPKGKYARKKILAFGGKEVNPDPNAARQEAPREDAHTMIMSSSSTTVAGVGPANTPEVRNSYVIGGEKPAAIMAAMPGLR